MLALHPGHQSSSGYPSLPPYPHTSYSAFMRTQDGRYTAELPRFDPFQTIQPQPQNSQQLPLHNGPGDSGSTDFRHPISLPSMLSNPMDAWRGSLPHASHPQESRTHGSSAISQSDEDPAPVRDRSQGKPPAERSSSEGAAGNVAGPGSATAKLSEGPSGDRKDEREKGEAARKSASSWQEDEKAAFLETYKVGSCSQHPANASSPRQLEIG